MAKKIKFSLEMADGLQVRTIEDLRENFNLEKVLGYFIDGRLVTWLNDRYYENEAEMIEKLSKDNHEIKKTLCKIFDVEYQDDNELDIEEIQYKKQKRDKLKQFTDDEEILSNAGNVAFNQEELSDLLDEGSTQIYLCDGEFTIPLSKENIIYIGISKPTITINSKVDVDLDKKNIVIENSILKCDFSITLTTSNSKGIVCEGKIEYKNTFNDLKNESKWSVCLRERRVDKNDIDADSWRNSWSSFYTDNHGKNYIGIKSLYRGRNDGSDEELIVKEDSDVLEYCVYKNIIFYMLHGPLYKDGCIYKIDINGENKENLDIRLPEAVGSSFSFFNSFDEKRNLFCNEKWLIWIESNRFGSTMYKTNHDGKFKEEIASSGTYNMIRAKIVGKYIFYTVGKEDYLYRVDLESSSIIHIDSNVRKIDTDGENLYYLKWESTGWGESQYCFYKTDLDGKDKILLEHHYPHNIVVKLKYKDGVLFYYTKRKTGLFFSDNDDPEIENKIIINGGSN